jgi:hypothetical protein
MSWKGFKRGLSDVFNPPYLRDLSPTEREQRTRRRWRNSELFFFFQALEPHEHDKNRPGDLPQDL